MRGFVGLVCLLPTLALAGPPRTPPGLARVCEDILPEPTTEETVAEAWRKATNPVQCDLAVDRGICLFGGSKVLMADTGALAVVPVEHEPAAGQEQLLFVATAFDVASTGGPVDVDFTLPTGYIVGIRRVSKGVELKGHYLPPADDSGLGTMILDVEGQRVELPVTPTTSRHAPLLGVDVRSVDDAASYTITARVSGDDALSTTVSASFRVRFTDAAQ